MTKNEKTELAVENAVRKQIEDDLCARATMYGLRTVFDFIPESFVKASASFAGGCGSAGGTCGAYCSALLAVGLCFNSTMAEESVNPAEFERTASKFNEFRERFLAEYGTVLCPEIHKKLFGRSYLLTDPAQFAAFMALPGHVERCAEVVAAATRIAAEMILSGGPNGE
jgi:C_GCAxxG_C_C family probable redox protein